MVVWQMPCESSSPPGSQLSQKAQSKDWAFLHFTSCKMSFGPASLSKSAPADLCLLEFSGEPFEQGISHATKLPGAVWNGEAGPKGGGLEARNTVVHRQTDKTARCRLTAPEFRANLLQFRTKPLKLPPKPAQLIAIC